MKGIVLDIERFSIHDGPGIRTTVFLKGCPLKCIWCSTPDGQRISPELEYFANKCIRCGKCLEVCPVKAIKRSSVTNKIVNYRNLCVACGKCAQACPTGARRITGKEMTVEQVIEIVESDALFYFNSGGGITLSGGEPTMQPDFSAEILRCCKEIGIHTCIETSGYAKWEILNGVLKYVDLIYVDIKHMSTEAHKKLTGKSNTLILENIQKIAIEYPTKPVIIRVPVIPGLNDDDENIITTALFVRRLKRNYKIELLPYHKLGIYKYDALSRKYPLRTLEPPTEAKMHSLKRLLDNMLNMS